MPRHGTRSKPHGNLPAPKKPKVSKGTKKEKK